MDQKIQSSACRLAALALALPLGLACCQTNAAVTILGAQYQPDQMFPEYDCFWHDGNYPTSCQTNVQGATVHVYVKNTDASAVTINDATLAGYSLKTVIKKSTASWNPDEQNSIYFYWDNPPQDILNAGEPVWYRFDPPTIPAGGVAKVAVRLRFVPITPTINVGVVASAGTVSRNITIDANAPQLASIGYSDDVKRVYLHWRRSGGAAPTSVWLDGTNVTSLTTTVGDPGVNFGASVVSLTNALPFFSYHVFQGVYADGKTATASQRAWTNKFIYASYSTFTFTANYTGADWVAEADDHGVNNVQMTLGDMGSYMGTSAGQAEMRAHGYGYTIMDYTKLNPIDPDMWFLNDEPDAEEDNQSNTHCGTGLKIPCGGGHNAGTLVIKEIAHGEDLRARRPNVPTVVNLNNTLKPQSYFTWGQAVDILQFDNYYQRRLSDSYWRFPRLIPLFRKATYVYAHARVGCAGAEPNPSNQLLYSCEWRCPYEDCGVHNGDVWPFPTPESKRIEVYYSLAGGSKGLGYWWFKAGYPPNGIDAQTPKALALWKEIGLLGNEIKAARPLLVTSTPVDLTIAPSANVWARALASGTDRIILLVVNDNYYNDETGCHYAPVGNAMLTATLPSWMQQSLSLFEISAVGLSDVSTALNGSQLQVNLGTLNLTRMIVLTTDPQLRMEMQQRYDQEVKPHVRNFAPELFLDNPPSITQQPSSLSVSEGGTANLLTVASGTSPLSYQWQKNQVNLSNAGHYSGCTTAMLTIAGADSTDEASYRCVVTNAYGSATSRTATLSLATNVFGSVTLSNIPPLAGDTTNDARAITPDGRWVVGLSGSRGFLHAVNTTNVVNVVTPDGAGSSTVTGVGSRTENGQREVVISGLSSGWNAHFMTTNGTDFGSKRRDTYLGKKPTAPLANALAGTATDVFYSTWWDVATSGYTQYVGKMFGAWPMSTNAGTVLWDKVIIPSGVVAQTHGVSSTGRTVGYRNDPKENYVFDWNGSGTATAWFFKGLDNTTKGEAFAVSADGLGIFGQSPVSGGRAGSWPYKAVVTGATPGVLQSVKELPGFADTIGSSGSAGVPYGCTADGKYAVGMSYRSMERAVLWDARDPNPTNWTVVDLTELALANGCPDIFSRLMRAYSVGTNTAGDLVIAGVGLDTNSPAKLRAFVMTVALSRAPVVPPPLVTLSGSYPAVFIFTFPTFADANLRYYLEYTTNLARPTTWTTIASAPGAGAVTSLSDRNPPDPQRFYRIRVQAAPPPLAVSTSSPAGLTFSFPSVAAANIIYCLEYTTNLTAPAAWTTITSAPGYPALSGLSDPNPSDRQRFYRIRVQ